jgi:hypothetical protein
MSAEQSPTAWVGNFGEIIPQLEQKLTLIEENRNGDFNGLN